MELTLVVDHQCNLRCTYCYTGEKFTRRMTTEVVERALDLALRDPGPRLDVSFFGGEPLLRLELLREVVERVERRVAAQRGPRPALRFILNTNATLVDDEALALMAAPRKFVVYASVDGPADVHDRRRVDAAGRGSHERVLAGIARLRCAGIPFHTLAVVGVEDARRLGDTVRALLALEPMQVLLSPDLRDAWTESAIGDLRSGLHDAGDAWMEAFRHGAARAVDPLHTKILSHLAGGMLCPSRCQLAGRELAISPSGRIYPCAQMVGEDTDPTLVVGHVDRGLDRDAVARLQAQKEQVEDTCRSCELRDRCQSHCGCRQVALTGQLGRIGAALCELEAAFVEEADRVAETLHREGCPAFLDYYYRRPWRPASGAKLTPLRRARDV